MNSTTIRTSVGAALLLASIGAAAAFSYMKQEPEKTPQAPGSIPIAQNEQNAPQEEPKTEQQQFEEAFNPKPDIQTIADGQFTIEYDANLLLPAKEGSKYELAVIVKRKQELTALLKRIPEEASSGPLKELRDKTIDAYCKAIYRYLTIPIENRGSVAELQTLQQDLPILVKYRQVELLNRLAESENTIYSEGAARALFYAKLGQAKEDAAKDAFDALWTELVASIHDETDDVLLKNRLTASLDAFNESGLYAPEEVAQKKKEAAQELKNAKRQNVRRLTYLDFLS